MNDQTFLEMIKPWLAQAARDGLRIAGVYLLSKHIIQGGDAGVEAFVAAGMTLAGFGWGWFTTIGMVKLQNFFKAMNTPAATPPAPEASKIGMLTTVGAIMLALALSFPDISFAADSTGSGSGAAATLPSLPSLPVKAQVGSACTPGSCSGGYIGAGLGGIGTNLNVIGNGLNGSAFAGGMLPTLKAGYLYSNNGWLFGAEATFAYQTNTTTTINGLGANQNGILLTEGVKFGGNFSQLLGQTQSPITIPPALANSVINIYGQAGTAQHQLVGGFASGEYGGAGVLFDVGPHSFVDVDYKNIQYGATKSGGANFNSENIITVSFNYKW